MITEHNIRDFFWKSIICRFRIPQVVIIDNRKQFNNKHFREFFSQLGIKNPFSFLAHPQANGQVEVTNMTILKIIKTMLEASKGQWAEELLGVLRDYKTTPRSPTGETPYALAFGCEAVILAEIRMVSLRIQKPQAEWAEGEQRLILDLMEEKRNEASLRMAAYQQRIMRYHKAHARLRGFQNGELVLRKVSIATQIPRDGKLGPNWEGPYRVIQITWKDTYYLESMGGKPLPRPQNIEHLKGIINSCVIFYS